MSRTRQPEKDSFYIGLQILEYLVAGRSSKGVSQIANALDAPVSSTHDILKLLVHLGFISQHPETHRYEATTGMFRLIHRFATEFGIIPHVRDGIREFTERLQCTLYLCRWWQGETHVVYAQGVLASTSSLGGHHPAHLSSAAKALLARQDSSLWEKYAPETGGEVFLEELAKARTDGVAWNIRQADPNVCSLSIPLGERGDLEEYALAMVVTPMDFEKQDRSCYLENLRQIRDEIVRTIPPL
jgi:IclR family transcriptional regulator, KDG regulon repressor